MKGLGVFFLLKLYMVSLDLWMCVVSWVKLLLLEMM